MAMISMRIKKFHKRTYRKLQFYTKNPVGFDKFKVECFNCHKMRHFARDCKAKGNQDSRRRDAGYNGNKARDTGRRPSYKDDSKSLVTIDGENQALKEKEDLKTKVENWKNSSKNLNRLINTQMSANDKFGLGYGDYRYGSILSYENEVLQSMFMNKECDLEDTHEYESDSDDDSVSNIPEEKEKPSFAFTNTAKHVKISRENVKDIGTPTHCPKVEKQGRNSHTRKGLGYAFTRKSCFVCGSFSHLIRDYDFHEKRIAKHAKLATRRTKDDLHKALKDQRIVNSGCSRHMTGNKAHLADYQDIKGGSVAFGGSNGRNTSKGKIKAGRLDFKDVYYVEELKHYNLFSLSQIYDKKNKVLFTDIDCLVLSPNFKPPDENQVLLKILRSYNMYSFNLKNIDPFGGLSLLLSKASIDESNKWHRG
nr:ribonuclease H-like domain-containing protein [Tanacetum cinerariifolium]